MSQNKLRAARCAGYRIYRMENGTGLEWLTVRGLLLGQQIYPVHPVNPVKFLPFNCMVLAKGEFHGHLLPMPIMDLVCPHFAAVLINSVRCLMSFCASCNN
jgi:hypothetical protein